MTDGSATLAEFLRLNRAASVREVSSGPSFIVDAAYRDPYIVTCTMKIAECAARISKSPLTVITAPGMPARTAEIIRSFRPQRVVGVKELAMSGAGGQFRGILDKVWRTRSGDDLVSLHWQGTPVGPHLYDTLLMRFGLPSLGRLTPHHRMHLFLELCILEGFRRLLRVSPPAMGILPDNVYRAGAFFELMAERRIPMFAGLDMNGLAAHYYSRQGSFSAHCRTPDRSLVDLVLRTPALLAKAEAYLVRRTTGRELQHDVKRAYNDDAQFVTRSKLCAVMNLTGAKPIALVAAHVFSDAPHACGGLIFRDYQDWLLETCRLLKANPSVDFIVKEHPSAELYGEQGLTERILAQARLATHFLPVKVNTRSLFGCVESVITCGGTAGAEFPCFGVPVLLAAGAAYDQLGYVKRAHDRAEYSREIGRLQSYGKLSDCQVLRAKAALFVMQLVSKIPKADLGLGSQPLMRGTDLDFVTFLDESIDDLKKQSGHRRLTAALQSLLDGPYGNLVDTRLIGEGQRV